MPFKNTVLVFAVIRLPNRFKNAIIAFAIY